MHAENSPVTNVDSIAYVGNTASAKIRQENQYFQVDEILGFDLAGEGEHLYVQISKNGQNSGWVKERVSIPRQSRGL